jgi:hypothetical protein
MFEVFRALFLMMHSDETEAIFILNYEYFWQTYWATLDFMNFREYI